ncbi:MAG: restriction endonuclease subunit S, partial [Verrucomicrobia bacterium]|nr:restriction endonuclease subunit S [Verrucomicrobiota bacterium]
MKYGLPETAVAKLCAVFAGFPAVEKAVLYGSRAKGNFKTGSDIDLTLYGEAVTSDLCSEVASALDDLLLPYTIDLSVFEELNHAKLREHIERVGVLFYERAQQGAAMKEGWQTKTLGEVLQRTETVNPLQSPEAEFDYIDVSSVSNATFQIQATQRLKGKDAPSRARKLVRANDILFATIRPTLQRIAVVPEHLDQQVCSTGYFVLRPKPGIDHRFVFYSLFTENFMGQMESLQKGASYPAVTDGDVKAQEIPVPPLPEQQRIVGILDEAFEGIATAKANAEKNLQNARAIFESHLQSVLRSKKWKWKTLGDLCDDVEYGSSAKSKAEGGVPVLRMGNIQDGRLDWENLVYTDGKAEIKKYLLKHNDVLFNRTNSPELVGKTAIYKSEMPAIFAGYLIRIHRKEDLLDADYLTYFLNSEIAFDYGKTVVISSVNQANINGTKLKSYPIPAPSLSEQKAIVAELDALSKETQRL